MSDKIDYENWDENEEENIKKAKEAVVLNINGKINMKGYEDDPTVTVEAPEEPEEDLDPSDIINPELAFSNKDNVPSSGIIYNSDAVEKAKALREKKIDNAFNDPHFPEIVHFQMLNDIEDGEKLKEKIDAFYTSVNDLMKNEESSDPAFPGFRDIPEDYELYDGMLFNGKYELFLHFRVSYNEIYEVYLTIEKDETIENIDEKQKEFEEYEDSESDFDLEGVEGIPEPIDRNAFLKYVLSEDKLNCRTLPISFVKPYIEKFGFDDWISTLLSAADSPYTDFDRPIRVKH